MGIRVGINARVISEGNVFEMGCNPSVPGPRVIRYVLPNEKPHGLLFSHGDFVSEKSATCPHTLDEGFIKPPSKKPFAIPYPYRTLKSREQVLDLVGHPR